MSENVPEGLECHQRHRWLIPLAWAKSLPGQFSPRKASQTRRHADLVFLFPDWRGFPPIFVLALLPFIGIPL